MQIEWIRRQFRSLIAILLCLAAWAPNAGAEPTPDDSAFEPFFFVVMADPQLGWATKNADFEIEEQNFRKAIQAANRLNPAFVVICGDLVNDSTNAEQIAAFQELMTEFSGDFPVHLVSGNHDVTGAPSHETIDAYRKLFGPDRYTFDHGRCRFLVINSTILVGSAKVEDECVAQWEWVETELARARADGIRDIFVAQHHPWFREQRDEPPGFPKGIPVETRERYLDLFESYGVLATFAGHLHRNQLGRDGAFEMITTASITPPFSDDPAGIRIVKVHGDTIEHDYYGLDEVPERVVVNDAP